MYTTIQATVVYQCLLSTLLFLLIENCRFYLCNKENEDMLFARFVFQASKAFLNESPFLTISLQSNDLNTIQHDRASYA